MANAASVVISFTATPDPGNNINQSTTATFVPTGNDTAQEVQVATTTPANLSLGSLTTSTCNMVRIRANAANTSDVLVSIYSGGTDYTFARLKGLVTGGAQMVFPMEDSSVIRVTASATTAEIFISAFQD